MSSNQEIVANTAAIENFDTTLRLLHKCSDAWLDRQTMYRILTESLGDIKSISVNFISRTAFEVTFTNLVGEYTDKGFAPVFPKENTISFMYNGLHITLSEKTKMIFTDFDIVNYNPFTKEFEYGDKILSDDQVKAFVRKECEYISYTELSNVRVINHLRNYIDNGWRFFKNGRELISRARDNGVVFEFLQATKRVATMFLDGVEYKIDMREGLTAEDAEKIVNIVKLLLN
jgi:fibronectin type 3 domain-containing protein